MSAVDKAGNEGPQTTPKVVVYDTTAPVAPATPTTSAPVTKVKPAISWTPRPTRAAPASPPTPCTATASRSRPRRSARATRTPRSSANGTYAYAIRANDAAGNASAITATVSITYDTVAPPVPVGLTGADADRRRTRR